MNTSEFNLYAVPFLSKCPAITFTEEEIRKTEAWAEAKSFLKIYLQENDHIIDGDKEVKRNVTGQLGEWAVEKYLNIPFVDWSIGESITYNHPDIGIKRVGIKTVEYGKLPVIHCKSYYPEIICVKKDNKVYIAGLATPEVLNEYQDSSFILDKKLAARGAKTCFYGFSHLQSIENFRRTTKPLV